MFNCFPNADARAQAQVGPGLATSLTTVESKVGSIVMSLSARRFSGIVEQAQVRLTLLGLHCTQMYVLLARCLFGPTTFYEHLLMSCLPQSCMDCVYLWNECQAWYQVRPMLTLYPGFLPAKSPDMRLGLWVEICFTALISEVSFYGMRVCLAEGSRKIFTSTRADLVKKGGGSQRNEVKDTAYFVHFSWLSKMLWWYISPPFLRRGRLAKFPWNICHQRSPHQKVVGTSEVLLALWGTIDSTSSSYCGSNPVSFPPPP